MRLYLAGTFAANFDLHSRLYSTLTPNELYQRNQARYLLESYHYVNRQSYVNKIRRDGVKIFLDSGAFSAFTKGVEIDLPEYCRYINENIDIIENVGGSVLASVLDGIGDPEKTLENQRAMEKLGVRPLPCYHYGEDESYLDYYVNNYDYITIGGMVPISAPQLKIWLDRIWEKHLTDGAGRPKVRVHGFGLTTMSLVERYPWFSVDSSSWIQIALVGGMMLYPEARVINVSSQSPQRKVEGQHIDTLSALEREALELRFKNDGVDVERMRSVYISRWAYNIYSFSRLGKLYDKEDPKFIPESFTLFD